MADPANGSAKTSKSDEDSREQTAQRHISVNMLCLIGATIGLASIFLPWHGRSEGLWQSDFSLIDIETHAWDHLTSLQFLSGGLFVAGTLLAFAFPMAGVIQATGLALFYAFASDLAATTRAWMMEYEFGPSIGYCLGVLSSALVLSGFLTPIGPGCDLPRKWWLRRTDVVARTQVANGRILSQRPGSPRDLFRAIAKEKRWAGAWLATVLLLLPLIYATIPSADDSDVVSGSVYGVTMALRMNSSTYWTSLTNVTLSDNVNSVNWSFSSPIWDFWHRDVWSRYSLTPVAFEERNLSGLAVEPTLIDWSGEGRISPGDLLVLTPLNGSSFEEGVLYRLVMKDEFHALDLGHTTIIITFEFDEGDIVSGLEVRHTGGYVVWERESDTVNWIVGVGLILTIALIIGAAYYLLLRPRLARL